MKRVQKDWCFYCKRPSFLGLTHPNCKKSGGVDGIVTVFHYNDTVKRVVKNIKYRLVTQGMYSLFSQVPQETYSKLGRYNKLYKNLIFIPIPLSDDRKRRRGFNQTEKFLDFINQFLSFPRAQNLIKKRETRPQSQMSSLRTRRMNIKKAFTVINAKEIKGKSVLLVDDVVTTGATVAEATRELKDAGVSKVVVFALAKG